MWFPHVSGGVTMDSKHTPARVRSGGTQISRRTVTRGVVWTAPIAVIATAAPAFAASPGPRLGHQLRHRLQAPGQRRHEKRYHTTFCFKTNVPLAGNLVYLDSLTVNIRDADTDAGDGHRQRRRRPRLLLRRRRCVQQQCERQGTLTFHYFLASAPAVSVPGSFQITVQPDNDLPPCDTGADPGNNPSWPTTPRRATPPTCRRTARSDLRRARPGGASAPPAGNHVCSTVRTV